MDIETIIRNHGIVTGGVITTAKEKIAAAIETMGQTALKTDSFDTLAAEIQAISTDATAIASDIYTGKTVYIAGVKTTGTMPDSTQSFTPGTADQAIPLGFHNGTGIVAGDADLVPGNIRSGVSIFGVVGATDIANTGDANLDANFLVVGYSGYDSGVLINGALPNATQNFSPGAADVAIPRGYYDGTSVVLGDVNLASGNIKSGATIFGVSGSSTVVDTADAVLDPAFLLAGYTGYDDGVKKAGTMPNSTRSFTPGTTAQTVPLGYHDGTGSVAGDANLVSGNIKAGTSIFGVPGDSWVVWTGDANNDDTLVLAGQIYYAFGIKRTGTMPNHGAPIWTPGTADQALAAGYYSGGTVSGDLDLVSANIKSGANIFGVPGSGTVVETSGGNLVASSVLSGYVGFSGGAQVNGTMANNGAPTWTPGTTNQTLAAGYYSGGTVAGDADLVAANILSGVTIFGVTGTASSGVQHAKLSYTPADVTGFGSGTTTLFTFNITGLTFTPVVAYVSGNSLVYSTGGGGGQQFYTVIDTTDTTNYSTSTATIPANISAGQMMTLSMTMTSVVYGGCTITVTANSAVSNNSFNSNHITINLFGS